MKTEKYSVKGVIEGIGHDLAGFKCNLYFDGKKVADVNDDGRGGNYEYHFISENEEQKFFDFVKEEKLSKETKFVREPELEPELNENIRVITSAEIYIASLIDKFSEGKEYKKWCKTKISIQLDEQIGTEKWVQFKNIWNDQTKEKLKEQLLERFKNQKIRILNEEVDNGEWN